MAGEGPHRPGPPSRRRRRQPRHLRPRPGLTAAGAHVALTVGQAPAGHLGSVAGMERTIFEPEHEQFRASFRRWVDAEIVPHYLQWEADGIVPREVFAKAGEHGF